MIQFVRFISLFLLLSSLHAAGLTLDLRQADLPDALRLIANTMKINVVISPQVGGTASIALHEASPLDAFNLLLTAHELAKWQYGNVWYIAPRGELIKRKEEESRLRDVADAAATLVTESWQIHYAKADDIAHLIQDQQSSLLSKRGQVRVDTRTNMLLIQDLPERIVAIRKLIYQLDVPVKQIEIEARLVTIDSDFERELGVHFGVRPPIQSNNAVLSAASDVGRYSIAVATLADGSQLDVKLSALELAGHADLISTPRLFTANQQSAFIEAGEEVPYQEVSESGGTAVTFKKAVLGLKVMPQVLPGDKVLLQLQINQDRPSNRMVQGVPTISTRQMVTSVLVKNGQTVVLGGIYEVNDETGQQRLPFLSDIPLIGVLFRTQTTRHSKRELLVFVTPKIMMQAT